MRLHPEEPAAGPWRVERIADVVQAFADRTHRYAGRPLVVAIDGRSSSGKTTLAGRAANIIPATAVVHTDDIAWWHSRFGWADLALRWRRSMLARRCRSDRPRGSSVAAKVRSSSLPISSFWCSRALARHEKSSPT